MIELRLTVVVCVNTGCDNNVRSGFRRCVSCLQGWTPAKRKEQADKIKAMQEEE